MWTVEDAPDRIIGILDELNTVQEHKGYLMGWNRYVYGFESPAPSPYTLNLFPEVFQGYIDAEADERQMAAELDNPANYRRQKLDAYQIIYGTINQFVQFHNGGMCGVLTGRILRALETEGWGLYHTGGKVAYSVEDTPDIFSQKVD